MISFLEFCRGFAIFAVGGIVMGSVTMLFLKVVFHCSYSMCGFLDLEGILGFAIILAALFVWCAVMYYGMSICVRLWMGIPLEFWMAAPGKFTYAGGKLSL